MLPASAGRAPTLHTHPMKVAKLTTFTLSATYLHQVPYLGT